MDKTFTSPRSHATRSLTTRLNVVLYPEFQKYLRDNRSPLLAVWGENEPSFIPAGTNAFKLKRVLKY
ncbi:MAG: hypothetical protein IJ190_01550 [Prevotella sp.]|nr:hypothetical protein [Prevotella sp.]